MTDHQKVLRCAELAGFEPFLDQAQWKLESKSAVACKLGIWSGECLVYDPLHDKSQALDLVIKLKLDCIHDSHWGWEVSSLNNIVVWDKDLLRAIVDCAAKIEG